MKVKVNGKIRNLTPKSGTTTLKAANAAHNAKAVMFNGVKYDTILKLEQSKDAGCRKRIYKLIKLGEVTYL